MSERLGYSKGIGIYYENNSISGMWIKWKWSGSQIMVDRLTTTPKRIPEVEIPEEILDIFNLIAFTLDL